MWRKIQQMIDSNSCIELIVYKSISTSIHIKYPITIHTLLPYIPFNCYTYQMKKQTESCQVLPLFVDTEFVPSKMHYFTLFNRKVSDIPTVLPYMDDSVTIQDLQEKVSRIELSPNKSRLMNSQVMQSSLIMTENHCMKDFKVIACKKRFDGEEVQFNTQGQQLIDFGKILNSKEIEMQSSQRCTLCCIMLDRRQEPIHLQFRWKSQEAAKLEILKAVNDKYNGQLEINDVRFHALKNNLKNQQQQVTISFVATEIRTIKEHIFKIDQLPFIGIQLKNNKLPKEKLPPSSINESFTKYFQICLPSGMTFKFNFQKIKQFEVRELLSILQVQYPQSRGLIAMNKLLGPKALIQDLTFLYQGGAMVNFIAAEIAQEFDVLMQELNSFPQLTYNQLKMINQEQVHQKSTASIIRAQGKQLSPLRLFNSACNININQQTSFTLLYHIIHKFIRNYFTHFNTFYDNSISGRFVRSMMQQIRELPVHKGEVYRRLGYELNYQKGDVIQFNNFIVASMAKQVFKYNPEPHYQTKITQITINSTSGKIVGKYSSFKDLYEVIFTPFTKFQVIQRVEDKNCIYLILKQVVQTRQRITTNMILWLDNSPQESKKFFNALKKFPKAIIIFPFTNNDQLKQWISSNQHLINLAHIKIIVITNMRRIQNGKQDSNAGITTIKIVKKQISSASIMVYIGNIDYTKQNLMKNTIDPNSLFITNQSPQLFEKIKKEIDPKPLDKIQLNKIQKQNWQIYFTNAQQQQNPFELVKEIPHHIKLPQIQKEKPINLPLGSKISQLKNKITSPNKYK